MKSNPIRTAVEQFDTDASPEFRDTLRAQILCDFESSHSTISLDLQEITMLVTQEISAPPARHRSKAVLAIAAAVIAVVGLAVVALSHRSEPTTLDTSHDSAIAGAAILDPSQLGDGFTVSHQFDTFPTRQRAEIAASVPECRPYVDYAFDSPNRDAVTADKVFFGPKLTPVFQTVYIFPTEEAATRAMDKIAEPGFQTCFNKFTDATTSVIATNGTSVSKTIEPPPLSEHGDRQVVLGQTSEYTTNVVIHTAPSSTGHLTSTAMHVFIQVGRGIVYLDPYPDSHDSLDPKGLLEKSMTAATEALNKALDGRTG